MDDELEHSPQSWLDDFTQRFSWCRLFAGASPFLNNYFLPGLPCEKSNSIFSTKDPRKYVGTSRPSFIRPIQVEDLTLRESKLRCA